MKLKNGREGVARNHVVKEMVQWWELVNMVMNIRFKRDTGNVLTRRANSWLCTRTVAN
jgi:hypothetical protein